MLIGAAGNLEDMARLIQLAVAPIFLLTAVATTLMILTGRLARIVDRGRNLEKSSAELPILETRARLIYRAISLGVFSAILVCFLMTLAFLSEMFGFHAAMGVAVLFIASLFSYTGALMLLLREIFLAIGNFRLGLRTPQK